MQRGKKYVVNCDRKNKQRGSATMNFDNIDQKPTWHDSDDIHYKFADQCAVYM